MENKPSLRDQYLIETDELQQLLQGGAQGLKIVNGTWFMPNVGRNAWEEHLQKRITGETVFFDHDVVCDQTSSLPHTLPSAEVFTQNMRKLHVQRTQQIVCYDALGMFSIARVAWMLRYFGAQNVRILNGGLKKWEAEGREMASGDQDKELPLGAEDTEGDYSYEVADPSLCIVDINQMHTFARDLTLGKNDNLQILDARAGDRFLGKVKEPRPGVRSGNISGSLNVPFSKLVNQDGTMKTEEELQQVFTECGVDLSKKETINSCGSGVTASVIDLALRLLGQNSNGNISKVYDGSWSEYGSIEEPQFK